MIDVRVLGHRLKEWAGMSFDTATDETRAAVAREAARAVPAARAAIVLDAAHIAWFQHLVAIGKFTDYPPEPPPLELVA